MPAPDLDTFDLLALEIARECYFTSEEPVYDIGYVPSYFSVEKCAAILRKRFGKEQKE